MMDAEQQATYEALRERFKSLDLPLKSAFLVEAFFTTLAEAADAVGKTLGEHLRTYHEMTRTSDAPPRE